MCVIANDSFLQDIVSALIGTGTAFFLFYLTIKSDKKKEKENLEHQTNNRIRNFKNLIESSISHAESTISNLEEIISNYETNLFEFQLLRFSPNKSFERLDELLKNEDYFQSYSKKYGEENVDTYNRVSLIIDFFNMQINQLWEMLKKAQEYDYQRKIKFKSSSDRIVTNIAKLTMLPNSGVDAVDIAYLGTLLTEFYDNMTPTTGLDYLYAFNRNALEHVLIRYLANPNVNETVEIIRESSVLFNEIEQQNKSHKNALVDIKNEMISSLARYKEKTANLR